MKNKKRLLMLVVLLMMIGGCCLCTSAASVKPRVNCWITYKGNKYWFNSQGKMVKNTVVRIKGKYYGFDSRGRMRKGCFVRNGDRVYFAGKSGAFLTGWQTINKKKFYFNSHGRALPGLRTINGKTYYFSYRGEIQKGWQIIDGKKYYFHSKTGQMLKNRTIGGIKIDQNGEAPLTTKELLDLKCQEILGQITNSSMSKAEKIRACFNYMASHSNFSYTTWRNFSYYEDWHVDYAYEMLTKRMGNCYNFACAFAYLTKAAGCDVTIVRGRVHGSRDGAADGFTRHCWTIVDSLYYDTELSFAGNYRVYGDASYPMSHQIQGYDALQ